MALGLATAALAATGDVVTVGDGDDTPVLLDIRSVSLSQERNGRLVARVTMYEDWTPAELLASSGPPGSICVDLWTTRRPGAQPPNYLVCATPRSSRRLGGTVLREGGDGVPARVGAASLALSGPTLTMRFTSAQLGDPRGVRFAGEATQRLGCPAPRGCFDRAPNRAQTRMLSLR